MRTGRRLSSTLEGLSPWKRGVTNAVLAGVLAHILLESRQHELLEHGFQVTIADGTAVPRHRRVSAWGFRRTP